MSCDLISKLKEAVIFETAWLYETMDWSKQKKEDMLEIIKVVWNRSIGRAGLPGNFYELSISEEEIKQAAERWSKEDRVVDISKIKN